MTYFLDDYKPEAVPQRRGPDMQPQSIIPSFIASFSRTMRDWNVNLQRQQEVSTETQSVVSDVFPRLGSENVLQRLKDKGIVPPFMTELPADSLRYNSDAKTEVLNMAREAAAADPERWKGVDLTDEGIEARVTERRKAEDEEEAQILSMSNHPVIAELLGSVAASVVDIRQAPLLFAGGAGGGSLLRVAAREALIGAAAGALTLPSNYKTAKELDKPDPSISGALVMGAGGGAVIGGGLHIIGKGLSALGRGLEYSRARAEVPAILGVDPTVTHAAVNAAEDALLSGENPLAAVKRIIDSAPPPEAPARPPLILTNPRLPQPVETTVLPPVAGEAPKSVGEIGAVANRAIDNATGLDAALADAKAADNSRAKPLIGWLRDNHRVTKAQSKAAEKAGRPAPTGGENYQIDPNGPLGLELKNAGVTPRTAPGLFKAGGRKELDNLVASEMEDAFPGIIDATRTARDATYIDRQGMIDLIVRDANGDASWLHSRADLERLQAEADYNQRLADGEIEGPAADYLSMKPADNGFFVDLNAYQFDNPDWQAAIARDLDAYMAEKWPTVTFTAKEREEILHHLTTNGGDAEYLVERALERELDYVDLPPNEVHSHAEITDPSYQRFLDEAEASRISDAGGEGAGGPNENGGAAGGGFAGEVGPDGQVSIPGTDRVDTGQAQRDRATIAARQQQSKSGRLDQTRVEDDAGGLFGGAQSDLFSDPVSPEARRIQDAVAADLRDQVAAKNGKISVVTQNVGGASVQSLKGNVRLLHGYSGRDTVNILTDFAGDRYPDGNVYGDGGIYLDGDGKWTANDPYRVMFETERVAEVAVDFRNALIMTPSNAASITSKARVSSELATGEDIANWAKAQGFDGVIVTGFDRMMADKIGPIPLDYMGDDPAIGLKFAQFEADVRAMGLIDDAAQDQVLAFDTSRISVVRDGLSHGEIITPIESVIDRAQAGDFTVDLRDGKGERSVSSLLDELDADDEFSAILDACGKGKA